MKKEEYISIAEFAKRANVNRSYIYKILSTKLSTYVRQVDNQKMLNVKALELFDVDQSVYQVDTEREAVKDLIELLQEQQRALKAELEIKNEQIRALNNASSQQLQLIDQQQKLQAIAETKRIEQEPKESGLLNRSKFSTEAEFSYYLCRLLPRIGLFSTKQDREELERVLELMSEEERRLVYQKRPYREAIEHIRKVDFDDLEKFQKQQDREKGGI